MMCAQGKRAGGQQSVLTKWPRACGQVHPDGSLDLFHGTATPGSLQTAQVLQLPDAAVLWTESKAWCVQW